MPKKSIIMLGGGIQQVPAVARLQSIGYRVIVTDIKPDAPAFSDADVSVNLGANDVKGLISWVLLNREKYNIAGIFTLTNYAATVAMVANATGLPSLPVETVISCDNKLLMKRKFVEYGFKTAEYYEVVNQQEAIDAYRKINSPCYLKVVDGFGGKGVCKVTSESDIEHHYPTLKQTSLFPEMILEKEIIGQFIDTQGIFYQGDFFPAGDADSFFSNAEIEYRDFNPVEIFNICPSQLPANTVHEAYAMLRDISRALTMNFGPVGGDFVLADDGLYVIEIGPRLHGPNGTLQMFPKAMNIKPLEFMAQVLCGDDPSPDFVKCSSSSVALCHVFTSPKREITEVGFTQNPLSHDGVFTSYIYHSNGKTLQQKSMTLSGLASVFVEGCDVNEATARLSRVKNIFYAE